MPSKTAAKTGRTADAAPATRKPRSDRGAGPQFQVACILLNAPDEGLGRVAIAQQLQGVDAQQLSNAFWIMKKNGRIQHPAGDSDNWILTAAGREWATGGANLDNQRAAARTSPAAVKRARHQPAQKASTLPDREQQRLGVVDTRGVLRLASDAGAPVPAPLQVLPPPSFRCSIGSDGCYSLRKDGVELELTPTETLEMLRYIDRIRGVKTPAPAAAAA